MENLEQTIKEHKRILSSTHYGVTGSHEEPETGYVGRGCSNFCEVDDYGQVPDFSDKQRAKAKQGLMEIAENESYGLEIREKAYNAAGVVSEWTLTGRLINQILPKPITRKKYIPENGDGHSHDDVFTETYKVIKWKHVFPRKSRKYGKEGLKKIMNNTKDENRKEHIKKTLEQAEFLDREIRDRRIVNIIKGGVGLGIAYLLYRDFR